jgi:hypothetical protein
MDVLLVTVTHRPDFERFRLLRRSLREVGAVEQFRHVVVVGREDRDLADALRGEPNLEVALADQLLPPAIERRRAAAHHGRRSWRHYVRGGAIAGWYAQQLIKLAMVSRAGGAQAVAFLDSDLVVVRPLERADFVAASGKTRFFVDDDMRGDGSDGWNRVSARLLGVDEALVTDRQFIHTPTVFDVTVASAMLRALGPNWAARLQAANAFEYPTYGAWVMGRAPDSVETSAPLPTAQAWT